MNKDETQRKAYDRRLLNLYLSEEFSLQKAKGHIQNIVNALSVISERRFSDTRHEILLWGIASRNMLDEGFLDALARLEEADRIDIDLFFAQSILGNGYGEGIYEGIVLPYLGLQIDE